MNRNTFIKNCKMMGYSDIKLANAYCDKYVKENYTEEDYINILRTHETRLFLSRDDVHHLRPTGKNGKTSKRYYGDGDGEGNR